jgi:putative two-component system response regulator
MTAVALLSVDGYQVEQADCGHSALSRVEYHPPDLIVLDVMMPGIDGYEVCRRLKRNDSTRLIPIIFVTALEDREARLKGIEAGGMTLLLSPSMPWNCRRG